MIPVQKMKISSTSKTGYKFDSVLCPAPKPHGPFEPFMREGFGIFAER